MDVLSLLPDSDSYSYQPATQMQRVQHTGAAGRFGPLVANPTARVPATWTLSREDYVTFSDFVRKHSDDQRAFLINLITKRCDFRQCIAFFDSESLSLSSHTGYVYVVNCTLQVMET